MKVFVAFLYVILFVAFTTENSVADSSYDEIRSNKDLFRKRRVICPTITFSRSDDSLDEVWDNMRDGIAETHITQLHRLTDKAQISKNRYDSGCTRMPKTPGHNCDEYPFASSYEGGAYAVIKLVPSVENSRQGGKLSTFYRENNIGDGDCYNVNLV